MSGARRRAGARVAEPGGRLLIPRVTAQMASIAHGIGPAAMDVTIVTLIAMGAGLRVTNTEDAGKLSQVLLAGYLDGAPAVGNCVRMSGGGPATGGSIVVLEFAGLFDLSQQWALRWPSDSQLVMSQMGGTLGGILGIDEDVEQSPMGSLYFGPNDGGLLPRPLLLPIVGAGLYGATIYQFQIMSSGAEWMPLLPGATIAGILNGAPVSVLIYSVSPGGFLLDFGAFGSVSGQSFIILPWCPFLRDEDGAFVAPCGVVLN